MATTDRELQLIQEELRCLRQRFRNTVSTAGGHIDGSITVPGSSVFPNSSFADCTCVGVNTVNPDPPDICPPTETGITALGALAGVLEPEETEPLDHGFYVFDALLGVYFRDPETEEFDSRNTGLEDTTLEHGDKDPWWKSRTDGDAKSSAILWTVGNSFVRRSVTAGLGGWDDVTPNSTVPNLTYLQVLGDPFQKRRFYLTGWNRSNNRAFIFKTNDDGQTWDETELTTFDSATERIPIWMALSGNGGSTVFLTSWYDNGSVARLDLIEITASSLSPTTSFDLGNATEQDYYDRIYVASPATSLDDEALLFLYGRMPDPDSLGMAHIVRSDDGGSSFAIEVNDWGLDWVGSIQVSMSDGSGNNNYYAIRNPR